MNTDRRPRISLPSSLSEAFAADGDHRDRHFQPLLPLLPTPPTPTTNPSYRQVASVTLCEIDKIVIDSARTWFTRSPPLL